ncbi:hypothetical protein ACFL27_12715 [candidate division CSSED10-310 bacterium]|uniref:Uncharacterized protein n=1 Tax=candidate division CSSED10-310 bacterium TaxID=2855610 RepID=A0ABV6YXW5_UNCC1
MESEITENHLKLLDNLAQKIVERRMAAPAIFFLEVSKPLNFIGSQMLVFFEPIIQTVYTFQNYDSYRQLLEKREAIELLLVRIEALDAEQRRREKEARKRRKEQRRARRTGKN